MVNVSKAASSTKLLFLDLDQSKNVAPPGSNIELSKNKLLF